MKTKSFTISLFLVFSFFIGQIHGQIPSQRISGFVVDKDSRLPLIGAAVFIVGSEPEIGVVTDLDGYFELNDVSVGRIQLQCTYIGYESFVSDPFILNSARAHEINIEMIEAVITTAEVVVSARKFGNEPLNELSILSSRSFSVEETQRYAASVNDPGRMVMGFPGVQPSRDSRSDVIIRGNSGIGMLWRLEGIDIPNPNHFARRGNSGGGITIFSVSMLANSDFSTSAFPAEYGNATSGVFDIKFRKGNSKDRQHTFRAGLLGLDYSTEGPLNKSTGSSYLVNYRYSTLGILNKLGLHLVGPRVDNTFQDLSFNFNFPSKDKTKFFTIWGLGGLSRERENAVDGVENWKAFSDYYTRDFHSDMGALGMTYFAPAGKDAFWKTSLALMGQHILFQNDTLNNNMQEFLLNDEQYKENRMVLSSVWNKKMSSRLGFKTGIILTHIMYDLFRETLYENTPVDSEGNTQTGQAYVQFRYRPTEKLTFNVGGHFTYFALNEQTAIEPRLGLKYQLSARHSMMLALGIHSKVLPIGNYFTRINGALPNIHANLLRVAHTVAGYEVIAGDQWKIRIEGYYQRMFDVPVASTPGSSWSILNTIDGFAKHELINTGTGENKGVDLILEKAFSQGTFVLLSGSIFDSEYTDASGRTFPTVFNSRFSATGMGGKEWSLKKGNQLILSGRGIYNGGQRLTPIKSDGLISRFSQEPELDDSKAFSEQVAAYIRFDLRFSFRKNNPKSSWWIALDIQNLLSRRNIDALNRVYDPDLNSWVYREQSGLTPVLSFQIDF